MSGSEPRQPLRAQDYNGAGAKLRCRDERIAESFRDDPYHSLGSGDSCGRGNLVPAPLAGKLSDRCGREVYQLLRIASHRPTELFGERPVCQEKASRLVT
jgi:hypothetical protein